MIISFYLSAKTCCGFNLSYDRVHSLSKPGKVMGNRLCLKKSWDLDKLDFFHGKIMDF